MARIKITIQDTDGDVIQEIAQREYELDLGQGTLAEIEGAVDEFKKRALVEIEKAFLVAAQARFVEDQKKACCNLFGAVNDSVWLCRQMCGKSLTCRERARFLLLGLCPTIRGVAPTVTAGLGKAQPVRTSGGKATHLGADLFTGRIFSWLE